MSKYITVDMGTTNTRINLISSGSIAYTSKYKVGISNVKTDSTILTRTLKEGIGEILDKFDDIECVISCGMITSELGLCSLPHISVPCGIKELASSLHMTTFPEICDLPFVFITGVKSYGEDFEYTDVMRGEETELLGLSNTIEANCLYVLPGSHSKLIYIDDFGRICRFSTELTGELMSSISANTILNQSIDLASDSEISYDFLKKGYLYAKEHGVNAAFFKVRILANFFSGTKDQLCSFFKGVVLCDEIENIINSKAKKVVIGGKAQLRNPMCYLIKEYGNVEVVSVSDDVSDVATAIGMVKIYEYAKKEGSL